MSSEGLRVAGKSHAVISLSAHCFPHSKESCNELRSNVRRSFHSLVRGVLNDGMSWRLSGVKSGVRASAVASRLRVTQDSLASSSSPQSTLICFNACLPISLQGRSSNGKVRSMDMPIGDSLSPSNGKWRHWADVNLLLNIGT